MATHRRPQRPGPGLPSVAPWVIPYADQNLASNLFLVPLGKTAVLTGLGTDLMEIISSHIGLSGAF
nr:hypothetical protein [Ottowia sp.]